MSGPATAEQLGSFSVIEPIPCFFISSVGNFMETCLRFSLHSFFIDFSMSSATAYILSKNKNESLCNYHRTDANYLRAPRQGNHCKPTNVLRLDCKMFRRVLKLLEGRKNISNNLDFIKKTLPLFPLGGINISRRLAWWTRI